MTTSIGRSAGGRHRLNSPRSIVARRPARLTRASATAAGTLDGDHVGGGVRGGDREQADARVRIEDAPGFESFRGHPTNGFDQDLGGVRATLEERRRRHPESVTGHDFVDRCLRPDADVTRQTNDIAETAVPVRRSFAARRGHPQRHLRTGGDPDEFQQFVQRRVSHHASSGADRVVRAFETIGRMSVGVADDAHRGAIPLRSNCGTGRNVGPRQPSRASERVAHDVDLGGELGGNGDVLPVATAAPGSALRTWCDRPGRATARGRG